MKNFRMFFCVVLLAGAAFLAAGSAQATLLAYFPFEDNSPDDVIHGLTATVNGAPTYVTGQFGDAISFDGIDDYLDVVDDPGNDVLEALDGISPNLNGTIMFWVKTTQTTTAGGYGGPTYVERRQPGSTFKMMYHLELGPHVDEMEGSYAVNFSTPPFQTESANTQYGSNPPAPIINDGQWHHIAASVKPIYEGTQLEMYIYTDGYLHGMYNVDPDYEGTDFTLCEDLHIGARETNGGVGDDFAEAVIDELAIYDEYMTGTAIRDIMANGVLAPVTIPGDTNDDKIVNDTDATTVASHWGQTIAGGASVGDFNADGVVDAVDASIMAAHWGDHNEGAGGGAVPEPSVLVFLLGLPLFLLKRRR